MEPNLVRLADSLAGASTVEELTRPLLEMLEAITGLESTYLTRIDLDAGLQKILYARNTRKLEIPEGLTVPWEDTLCKRALDEGRMFTDDVGTCWGDSDAARALGIQTYVSAPVRLHDGELYGTLCGASAARAALTASTQKVLGMFAQLIGQHIARERLLVNLQEANARLALTALTDSVTGLPNRHALFEEIGRMLARCRREGTSLAVAYLDLDGFKAINDTFGHEAGDRMLALFAGKLRANCRAGDYVGRVGGDEFLVLGPVGSAGVPHATDAIRASLTAATRGDYDLGGQTLTYEGASVGVILAGSDDQDPAALVARADAAMYEVKRARRIAPKGGAQGISPVTY